jgi:hypothetical protein
MGEASMISRPILTLAALLLFVLGLVIDFMPQETAVVLGLQDSPTLTVLIQSLAAALLGMGLLNWFSKTNPMGGIYSRPLGLANMLLFGVSAITLVRASLRSAMPLSIRIAAVVATVFAAAFVWLLFFHDPVGKARQTT